MGYTFKSDAEITAAPSVETDGNWHITQTNRTPGTPTEIFLRPVHVAGGRCPAVGTKGTLTEKAEGRKPSTYRWEPNDPTEAGPVYGEMTKRTTE